MKQYYDQRIRSAIFRIIFLIFILVGWYALLKHEDYLDLLLGVFFGIGFPFAYFAGWKNFLQLSEGNLILKMILFKDKIINVKNITELNIEVLSMPATAYLCLRGNREKEEIKQISRFFNSKKEFQEFFTELKKINPDIKDNVNWDSFPAKYMIW